MKRILLFAAFCLPLLSQTKYDTPIRRPLRQIAQPAQGLTDMRYISRHPVFGLIIGSNDAEGKVDTIYARWVVSDFILAFILKESHVDSYLSAENVNDTIPIYSIHGLNTIAANPLFDSVIEGFKLISGDSAAFRAMYISTLDIYFMNADSLHAKYFASVRGDSAVKKLSDPFDATDFGYDGFNNYFGRYEWVRTIDIITDSCFAIVTDVNFAINHKVYEYRQIKLSNGEIKWVDGDHLVDDSTKVYIIGTWTSATGSYTASFSEWEMPRLKADSMRFGTDYVGNRPTKTVRISQANVNPQRSSIVPKRGGVLFRHDNFIDGARDVSALLPYVAILDKYDLKGVFALNEHYEGWWTDGMVEFWRWLQSNGHEVADHGPDHTNFSFEIAPSLDKWNEDMPGILHIEPGALLDEVFVDTVGLDATSWRITGEGYDIMLKRGQELFQFLGLSPFTYAIQGGGVGVQYDPDSVSFYGARNGVLGGTDYYEWKYYHPGHNPPLSWGTKVRYGLEWLPTNNVTFTESPLYQDAHGVQGISAAEVIRKIVSNAARGELTIIGHHVQTTFPEEWWLGCLDSVCTFLYDHQLEVPVLTATEWVRDLYMSTTDPAESCLPHNQSTGQVFEDDIDLDGIPDGWSFGLLNVGQIYDPYRWGSGGGEWIHGGSQRSYGCVSVSSADTLYLHDTFGVQKGLNVFSIDVKDKPTQNPTEVYVKLRYFYGDSLPSIASADRDWTISSTAAWVTTSDTISFPYNTSYIRMWIWGDSGTDHSLVDEIKLRENF